jgi:hypothetical protein
MLNGAGVGMSKIDHLPASIAQIAFACAQRSQNQFPGCAACHFRRMQEVPTSGEELRTRNFKFDARSTVSDVVGHGDIRSQAATRLRDALR